jgi:O-antigen ligase
MPVVLTLAHLLFGANQAAASAWLTAGLGLMLVAATLGPVGRSFPSLRGLMLPAALFAAVLAGAFWSLTPWGPGGPHPVWAWAGIEPGALTIDRDATRLEIVKLLGFACAFAVGALQAGRLRHAQVAVELIVWIGAVHAMVSLMSFLTGTQVAAGDRLTGGFLSANSGGTMFGLLIVLSLALFLREWRRGETRDIPSRITAAAGPIATTALATVCLWLTASRMALAATLVASAVLLAWSLLSAGRGRKGGLLAGALIMLVVAAVLISGGNDLLWTRLANDDPTFGGRADLFAAHWKAFTASPLTGWGLGTFDAVNLQIMTVETAPSLWTIRAAHNVYLQWLEEAGLVGTVPMFALMGVLLVGAVNRAARRGPG